MKKDEDKGKSLPIEKYRHFKGIYIESTQEYYLCDFYEVTQSNEPVSFRVLADLKNQKQLVDIRKNDSGWYVHPSILPKELEKELIKLVVEVCIPKIKKTDEETSL